jgi:dihydropteroate synthase
MGRFVVRVLAVETRDDALRHLGALGTDPVGIEMMASKMLTRCIHIKELACRQANILKQEMLALGGDAAVARGSVGCSIPATDVILIGTEKQLGGLCDKLHSQPFGLAELAGELRTLLAGISGPPPFWKTARRRLSLERPLIMGILNVTPDSFSDGGRFIDPDLAVEQALRLEDEGADVIDIGGESTRPGAHGVPVDDELRRVMPVIERLAGRLSCPISIDTRKGRVAEEAVGAGAEIVNDVSGLCFDPGMATAVAVTGAAVVLTHSRGTPDVMQRNTEYDDLVADVAAGLERSLDLACGAGVERERIALDPGFGFGKSVAGNLEMLRRLREFTGFGLPLLVGLSRKSFITTTLGPGARLPGTAAAVALAVANGAAVVRVHDVREMRAVADMAHAVVAGN